MILETKISNGKFDKAKARNVAQGHKGNLFKLISIEHVIIGSKTQWKTM